MTEKEEKFMLLASVFMVIAAILTVTAGWYLKGSGFGGETESVSANDGGSVQFLPAEEPYQELYYISEQGWIAGAVTEANEKHAACFVIVDSVDTEPSEIQAAADKKISIFFNDEFVIPGYDSRALALDIREFFIKETNDTIVSIAFSEDETLQDAMVPAVKIKTNLAISEVKRLLSDCVTTIFTETEEKP